EGQGDARPLRGAAALPRLLRVARGGRALPGAGPLVRGRRGGRGSRGRGRAGQLPPDRQAGRALALAAQAEVVEALEAQLDVEGLGVDQAAAEAHDAVVAVARELHPRLEAERALLRADVALELQQLEGAADPTRTGLR